MYLRDVLVAQGLKARRSLVVVKPLLCVFSLALVVTREVAGAGQLLLGEVRSHSARDARRRSVVIAVPVEHVGHGIFFRRVVCRGNINASDASNASKGKSVGAWAVSISVWMVLCNDYVHDPARLDA